MINIFKISPRNLCNHKKWFAFFTILIFPTHFWNLMLQIHSTSFLPVSFFYHPSLHIWVWSSTCIRSKFSVLHELVPFLIILFFLSIFLVGTSPWAMMGVQKQGFYKSRSFPSSLGLWLLQLWSFKFWLKSILWLSTPAKFSR